MIWWAFLNVIWVCSPWSANSPDHTKDVLSRCIHRSAISNLRFLSICVYLWYVMHFCYLLCKTMCHNVCLKPEMLPISHVCFTVGTSSSWCGSCDSVSNSMSKFWIPVFPSTIALLFSQLPFFQWGKGRVCMECCLHTSRLYLPEMLILLNIDCGWQDLALQQI